MLCERRLGEENILYPSRSGQLPLIKQRRKVFLKKLVGESDPARTREAELTYKEFLVLGIMINMDISYLIHLLDLSFKYGPGYTGIIYIFLQLSVGMPLLMLCLFLSSYSKKSFITFWECVPLLEGLGYTVGILGLLVDAFNSAVGVICMSFFTDLVGFSKRRKILNCEINGNTELCVTPGDNISYDCLKPHYLRLANETIYPALQYHLRINILRYNPFEPGAAFITKLFLLPMATWIAISLIASLGATRLKKFAIKGVFILATALCIICTYSVAFMPVNEHARELRETEGNSGKVFFRFEFWVDMIILAGEVNTIANIIWLGTLMGPSYSPEYAIFIISIFKMIVCMCFFCFVSRISHGILHAYKLPASSCLVLNGVDYILAIIPEVLLRARFGAIAALTWYFGICFFAIMKPIFSLIAVVSTVIERFVVLTKYRLIVYIAAGLVGILLSAPIASSRNIEVTEGIRFFGPIGRSFVLFMLILALLFMYSTNRIIDDYSFTYGVPPQRYWIVFWRTLPLIGLIALIFALYRIKVGSTRQFSNRTVIASYTQMGLFLMPILVTSFVKCCTHIKYKTLTSLSRPRESWGPYNYMKRQARKYFYPQRDVKYRNTTLKCTHECIVNRSCYQEERRNQRAKIRRIATNFQNRGDFSEFISA